MNSTYAIQESVLMDFVPKSTRARWKSLESVASFGWCGSAVLGGVLADASSYSSTFFFTAGFQFAGTIVLGLLVVVVPRVEKKGPGRQGREEADMTEKRRLVELDLEEPLLG
jgi:hypothetical protein